MILHGSCVCMFKFLRGCGYTTTQNEESHDSGVCEIRHTGQTPKLVSLVSIVLVLVWYYKCKLTNSCSTKSSTTKSVVV